MAANNINSGSSIGDKIRSFRTMRHLTQKQLGKMCGISESAIRNYELSNRYPDEDTLMSIADALQIDRAALRDPDPNSVSCVEQFLFSLEKIYGLVPKLVDGELHLVFDLPNESTTPQEIIARYDLADLLYNWCGVRDSMLRGDITQDDYNTWQIAHSDIIGTDETLSGYRLPLEQQKEMESARRSLGLRPIPVFDENHVNVMPLPDADSTASKTDEVSSSAPAKQKRKRKPKNK